MLEIKDLTKTFGGLKAINQLNIKCEKADILGVIGPNGAGKSTLFNLINGIYKPDKGEIVFQGKRIDGLSSHRIAQMGIARTFQIIHLFKNLNSVENVLITYGNKFYRSSYSSFGRFLDENYVKDVCKLLQSVGLRGYENSLAKNLPLGLQRKLEIARAIALNPTLILLDEPASGLSLAETEEFMSLARDINKRGKTIILIEHNMRVAMGICNRIIVLNYGMKIAEGTPKEISCDPNVIKAYLGEEK